MFDNDAPVDEGDKIRVADDERPFIVTWVSGLSVKAEPAGVSSLADSRKWDTDDLAEKVESGDVTVLSDNAPVTPAGREVAAYVDVDALAEVCEGRHGLRTNRPSENNDVGALADYVCRMAQFHSGRNPSVPVMARGELQTWLDEHDIDATVGTASDEAGEEVLDVLEAATDAVLAQFNADPGAAAKRWEGLAY